MSAVLGVPPYLQFFDSNGDPLSGGKIYTYAAGTTTPKATYTDAGGLTEADNPIDLDASGIPDTANGSMWLIGSYKFVVEDSLGNEIRTTDNVTAFTTLPEASDAFYQSFSGNGSQTAFTLSADLGTEEKDLMIFINKGLQSVVTNGTFATDTDWTKGAGWTIAAGVATATGAISTAISQTAPVTLVEGQAYRVTYTITRSAGGLIPSIGGTAGTERTASGTYNEVIVCGSSQTIAFTGNGFTGTLDTISINPAVSSGADYVAPTSYTVNGTALTFTSAPPAGTNNIQVTAPSLAAGAASSAAAAAEASATAALASEVAADASEVAAAASAAAAASYAGGYNGTSTTSTAIATGAKTFTTQSGKLWVAGQFLQIASAANSANYMNGTVTSYSGASLVMNITNIGGSGTLADWNIAVSGTQGATGATGATGTIPLMNYGGMNFDGSTDYLDGNALTGIADGKKGSLFIVVRLGAASATEVIFESTGAAFRLQRTSAGRFQILGENSAGTTILSFRAASDAVGASAGTYAIMASWDLATPGSGRMYVNDVSSYSETTYADDMIDYTVAEYSVGATVTGSSKVTGDIYSLWFDATTNLEFNTESVRRRFIDANLQEIYLGYYGELPTGTSPILFLGYESGLAWAVNRGTATSTFTINGTPVAATTSASGQYAPKAINNLMGAATLSSGTIAVTINGLTTSDRAFVQLVTTGGTLGAGYKAVCTANTLTITSVTAAGATQTLDTSTVNYMILKAS